MQMVDVVQIKQTKHRSIVPIAEFEALFSQLRQVLHPATASEVLEHIGYAGGSHVNEWRKKGNAPTIAVNAAKGVLAELRVAPQARVQRTFDLDELAALFVCVMRSDAPERAKLMAKIAKELNDVSR